MRKVFALCIFSLMVGTAFAQYVDLGLPSGTLWKSRNEDDDSYFVALRAKNNFDGYLPSAEQIDELQVNCVWYWQENGFLVEGPNGNTIFFPANGQRSCEGTMQYEQMGFYWTNRIGDKYSYYCSIGYSYGHRNINVLCDSNCLGCHVRLVKKKPTGR